MASIRARDTRLRAVVRTGVVLLTVALPSPLVAVEQTDMGQREPDASPAVARDPSSVPISAPRLAPTSEERLGDGLLLEGIGAGLPSDGTLAPPTRDVAAVLRAQSDSSSRGGYSAAALPAFATFGYLDQPVPPERHPYALSSPIPLIDSGTHDGDGVRMVRIGTRLFDHPVAQASYGLANVASFDLTADQRYLDRAIAQAARLVDNRVESRDAWYLPYPFDFALHGRASETLQAPWYSAMAQGMAVSLFVALFERTNDEHWSAAAAGTVASFRNPPEAGLPWVIQVDDDGYLWLEEYATPNPADADFTFNGHEFATFGLYDYVRLTGDPLSTLLFDGAATTTRRYGNAFAPVGFRTRSWLSAYCLQHDVLDVKYHGIVTNQLIAVHSLTGDPVFARVSDAFRSDYPEAQSSRVAFARGTWTGYVFDSRGRIVRTKRVGFSRVSSAPSDRYARIIGRGLYYRITAGSLRGYWVPERASQVHAIGQYGTAAYYPRRTAEFEAGTTTGYRFDSQGQPSSSRRIGLSAPSSAPFERTAMFRGRRHAYIVAGRLAGYWVPVADLTLR